MSSHWRPEGKIVRIVPVRRRRPWGSVDDYLPQSQRGGSCARTIALMFFAIVVGLVAAFMLMKRTSDVPAQPDEPIEWSEVQAVPTRAPDAADVAWEKQARQDVVVVSPAEGPMDTTQQPGLPPATAAGNDIYVIDGDTFTYGSQHIRIANIDAPETHPPRCIEEARLGLAATQKLKQLLSSGTVTMSGAGHDQYGREVRSVQVDGQQVGEAMISAGLARSYDGKKRQGWC